MIGTSLVDWRNVLRNPFAALLFLVPGSEEVSRPGTGPTGNDPELLGMLSVKGKPPKLGLVVGISAAGAGTLEIHRGLPALGPAIRAVRESLPSMGKMVIDQPQPKGR